MKITIPHETRLAQHESLAGILGAEVPEPATGDRILINQDLTDEERRNVAAIKHFWDVWKALPFQIEPLRDTFSPDVTVRTGWRGEHVIEGREEALAMYAEEIERQTAHDEVTDFRFPVFIAKGPVVFHTWVWIATSERFGYHIERPMASNYLLTDGKIDRWDSYCTGPESAPGYVGGDGPDGL